MPKTAIPRKMWWWVIVCVESTGVRGDEGLQDTGGTKGVEDDDVSSS